MKLRAHIRLALAALPVLGGAAGGQAADPGAAPAAVPAASALGAGGTEPARAWSAEERGALELLRSLRKKERPSDAELGERLSKPGEAILPLYLEILSARAVPAPTPEEKVQVLSEVQEHALLLGVAELDREPVLAAVGVALRASSEPRRRLAAIGCIGAVGHANDLPQLFELTLTADESALNETLGKGLRRAVSAILTHDPRAFEQLVALRRITRPELAPLLLAAVGDTRDPRGLAYLSEVAYWNDGLILDVMSQVPLLGPSGDEAIDGALRVRLRAYLDENKPGPCRAAIPALVALKDADSIGPLIELLVGESAGLRESAHWALKQLTGLTLSPTPEVWQHWHQGEQYWLVRFKAHEFQRLRDNDPAVAADALRTISTHPLARKELVAALPDLLKNRTSAIRVLACHSLADMGAKEAIPKLVWALEDKERDVAQAAHAALRALTRLDLPCDALAWQSATHTEPRGTEL